MRDSTWKMFAVHYSAFMHNSDKVTSNVIQIHGNDLEIEAALKAAKSQLNEKIANDEIDSYEISCVQRIG